MEAVVEAVENAIATRAALIGDAVNDAAGILGHAGKGEFSIRDGEGREARIGSRGA